MKIPVVVIAGLIVFAACGEEAVPTQVPTPTHTATPLESAAPQPTPTATPVPTPTSTPTFTPPKAILPTPVPAKPTATPTTLEQLSRKLSAIALTTSSVRGLSFDSPINREFIDHEQARLHINQDFEKEREEIEAQEALYETLGAIPDVDLFDLLLGVYGEIILGFYDPEDEKIFVVKQDPDFGALDELTFSHELVHGLQQQEFDIHSIRESVRGNTDKSLAISALLEGDATVGETLYLIQHMDEQQAEEAQQTQNSASLDSYRAAPPLLQRTIAFPYEIGPGFVAALYQQGGGWGAVNQAYSRLPESTEHILHPGKYLEGEAPIAVPLPDLVEGLGAEWEMLWTTTLGEFFIFAYLERWAEPATAAAAAGGWGGDSYVLLRGPDDGHVLVWVLEWDTPEDAREFFDTYRDATEVRTDCRWEPDGEGDSDWLMRIDDQTLFAGLDYSRTTLIFAPGDDVLETARASLAAVPVPSP